ncbi:MAG TPA: AzlC family ABC transporter permease [Thermomicrobiales bacterium]|nr:AzlC family ABC transporter permease [Thermomicrobiales bacterium]
MNQTSETLSPPVGITFTQGGVVDGLRATAPLAISVATYGAVFGVLSRQVGVTLVEAMLMNVLVFAGAAQLASLDQWAYPLPIMGIVATVLLVNLRLIMLGASMRPWLKTLSPRIVYPMLHILSDEAWAVAMTRYRNGARDAGIVLGCNLAIVFAWLPAVAFGHVLGATIGNPAALGLDFAFTAVFGAMLVGGYRSRFDLAPWGASGMVAWIVWWLLPGTWYVIAGGLAGFLVAVLRADQRPHHEALDADGAMP